MEEDWKIITIKVDKINYERILNMTGVIRKMVDEKKLDDSSITLENYVYDSLMRQVREDEIIFDIKNRV